uniref:Putative cytochrome n=1 Tax=Xenopsylla cheopis TaxID=163159 RepID=A0A6M2DMD3_XENCH
MDLSINQSDIIILVILVLSLIYWQISKPHKRFSKTIVPYLKPVPILGTTWRNFLQLENQIFSYGRAYTNFPDSRFAGFFEVLKPILLIRDPELVKQMGTKDFDHFMDHNFFIDETTDPLLGNMMIVMRGQKWKDMRATLSPAFTGSKMRNMFNLVYNSSQQMSSFLKEEITKNGPLTTEVKSLFTKYSNDVIATCAFGLEVDSLKDPDNKFYKFGQIVTGFGGIEALLKFLGFNLCPSLMKALDINFLDKKTMKFFRGLVHETMSLRIKDNIIRPDMIHLLMQARKGTLRDEDSLISNPKRDWTEDELTAQALIFLIAGFDTSSTLLMFLAYELALNPGVQECLQEEVDAIMDNNKDDAKLTYEQLAKATYMDMVISETLRKWPPVVFLDRICLKDYDVEDNIGRKYTIKKGEGILFPVYHIQRDEKYFKDPEKFDPERFNEENKKDIKPYTYMPFGVGPRNCIGSRFALMETKALLFTILKSFSFKKCAKTEQPLQLSKRDFDLVPANGIWVQIEARH